MNAKPTNDKTASEEQAHEEHMKAIEDACSKMGWGSIFSLILAVVSGIATVVALGYYFNWWGGQEPTAEAEAARDRREGWAAVLLAVIFVHGAILLYLTYTAYRSLKKY